MVVFEAFVTRLARKKLIPACVATLAITPLAIGQEQNCRHGFRFELPADVRAPTNQADACGKPTSQVQL